MGDRQSQRNRRIPFALMWCLMIAGCGTELPIEPYSASLTTVTTTPPPQPSPLPSLTPSPTPDANALTDIISYLLEAFTTDGMTRDEVEAVLGPSHWESPYNSERDSQEYAYYLPSIEIQGRYYSSVSLGVDFSRESSEEVLYNISFVVTETFGNDNHVRNIVDVFGRPDLIYLVCNGVDNYGCSDLFVYHSRGFFVSLPVNPYHNRIDGSNEVLWVVVFPPKTLEAFKYEVIQTFHGPRGERHWEDIWVGADY